MSRFEKWLLKLIIAKASIQGDHRKNIEMIYQIIRECFEERFTEDNASTMDQFLKDRFELTQKNKK